MAQIANMTKPQLVALIVTELNIQTDDELRRDAMLARKVRRRRQAERALAAHLEAFQRSEQEAIGDDE